MIRLGYRNDLTQRLHHQHVIRVFVGLVCRLVVDEFDRRVDQESCEQVEHVRPGLDDHRTQQDEQEAEDQRHDNADQQHLLLVRPRDFKGAHNQGEHEQVIHRQ